MTAIRQADPNEALRLKVAELLLRASESHLETALAAIMKDASEVLKKGSEIVRWWLGNCINKIDEIDFNW